MDKSIISNEHLLNFENNLAGLINTHPTLPVITLANYRYAEVYDPEITYTGGTVGNSFVSRMTKFSFFGIESYVLEINKILIKEHLYYNAPTKYKKSQLLFDYYIESRLAKLKWKEAIFVYLHVGFEDHLNFT